MRYRSEGRPLFVAVVALLVALSAPAAARTDQISGVATIAAPGQCDPIPDEYGDFPPLYLTGSLEGCWYTNILTSKDNGSPSGVYQERGIEIFVGSLDGGPEGRFETTYKFSSKWEPDVSTGVEVKGRCQHPIVVGTGIGAFAGVTGRVDIKDDVATGTYPYRGHLTIP